MVSVYSAVVTSARTLRHIHVHILLSLIYFSHIMADLQYNTGIESNVTV